MTRPVVAVVAAGPGATERLRPLVRALSRHVDVRAADRAPDPAAWLVAGAGARELAPDGAPVAVADGGRLVVGGRRAGPSEPADLPGPGGGGGLAAGGDLVLDLPGDGVDTGPWPPIPPHVRRRWRQRMGLPDVLVVDTAVLAAEDVPTALALAAAAVVAADDLPLALALGCPSVVSAEAAAGVGAVDGLHVIVGGRAEADVLAGDDRAAAWLSRHGRAWARERLDPAGAVDVLLRAWGLAPSGPVARLDERLAELGTAPAAPIRVRAADALAALNAPRAEPPAPSPVLTTSNGGP